MHLSRNDLIELFARLDAKLVELESQGQPEDALWEAFESIVQVPSSTIAEGDRAWWREQLYATMERHGLTELSRGHQQN